MKKSVAILIIVLLLILTGLIIALVVVLSKKSSVTNAVPTSTQTTIQNNSLDPDAYTGDASHDPNRYVPDDQLIK